MTAVESDKGGMFFLYDYGGTGKTFVWKTLSAALRSKGEIVLNVASSGIASLLLSGGRTVHSRFAIPLVLGGDFQQILPVIPKGSRQDTVLAAINSSYLWNYCKVLRLTKNMRLQSLGSDSECNELKAFSEWISSIGDGTIGGANDGHAIIDIPDDLLLNGSDNLVSAIVDSTYPSFADDADDTTYMKGRAILALTLGVVEFVNEYIISLNGSEGKTYLSSDATCKLDANVDFLQDLYTPEFLNGIRCPGVPNHELNLKVGTPVMLLRNIDHFFGLCNDTRLVITRLGSHVLEAKNLARNNEGQKVLIPRMTSTPSDSRLPFRFQRRQFPLIVSYAMTINKSQGQSLSHVGLYLKKPIFNHGQLYVAVSRVTNRKGLKILICDKDGIQTNLTTNVVYKFSKI